MNFKTIHLIVLFLTLLLLSFAASAAPVTSASPSAREPMPEFDVYAEADKILNRKPLEPATGAPAFDVYEEADKILKRNPPVSASPTPAAPAPSARYELVASSMVNLIGYIIIYLSVPLLIRYVILRRPLRRKWTALTIVFFLFVIFSIHISTIREKQDREFARKTGITYKPMTHAIGSTILYVAMFSAYFILRRGRKEISELDEPDEEFLELLKSAVHENNLHTIPNNDLLAIYQKARVAGSYDPALPKIINTLKDELARRGLDAEKKCPSCKMMVPEEAVICPCCKKKFANRGPKMPGLRLSKRWVLTALALLVLLALAFIFRYDEEYIQGPLYRYDRFTSTIEVRRSEGSGFKWVPIPRFKNLQHVRDVRTRQAAEDRNDDLKRELEDMKDQMERDKR